MSRASDLPLYPTEDEIAKAVLGRGRTSEWAGIAATLEKKGLPQKDATTGRRYWPAVKDYFDRRHRLATVAAPAPGSMEITQCRQPPARRQG